MAKASDTLKRIMESRGTGISTLAASIFYGFQAGDIRALMRFRTDANEPPYSYLDTANGTFYIHKKGGVVSHSVPKAFNDYIISRYRTPRIIIDSASSNSLSTAFKQAVGMSFTDMRKAYIEEVGEIQPVPIKEPTGQVMANGKTRALAMTKVKVDDLIDEGISNESNKIRLDDTMRMQTVVMPMAIGFRPESFDSQLAYDRILAYFKSKGYAVTTCMRFITSLLKSLDTTRIGLKGYVRFFLLQQANDGERGYELTLPQPYPKTDVMPFDKIFNMAEYAFGHRRKDRNVRLFSLMIMESVNWRSDTCIGILRMSDLERTKLIDDNEEFSYMDLDNKVWHIKAHATKNGLARSIRLNDTFVSGVRKLYGGGHIYKDVLFPGGSVKNGSLIKRELYLSPSEIRTAYASYLYKMDIYMYRFNAICANMGHNLKTSISTYIKNIE